MDFKVSVVIPVYNAAPFLKEAVQSALSQPEVQEVLLIEDGSTDNSLEICTILTLADQRVQLHQHKQGHNRGAAATRNLGINQSKCPFITFLDADDVYATNRFSNARKVFENHPECQGVYEAVGILSADRPANKPLLTTLSRPLSPEALFYHISPVGNGGYFHLIGLTVKREVFAITGLLNPSLRVSQDTEWMLRIAATCILLPGHLDEPVAMRRIHDSNRSTDENFMRKHKPAMAMQALKWFSAQGLPADKTSEILRVFLKYHFEWVHLYNGGNRIWRKWKDITSGLYIWWAFPALRKNKFLIYHLRLTFRLPVTNHLNYYDSGAF